MRHYCTLFDKNYLAKGLAMIESLQQHSGKDFFLTVLALDDETYQAIPNSVRILAWKLKEFENTLSLQRVRKNRTWAEYCWSLASILTDYLLQLGPDHMTYLDADLMFFSDPTVIFDEIGDRSIGIIPHRLIPSKKHLEATSGTYNVGFVYFKNSDAGMGCVRNWARQCRERCLESDGGDQKYLNDWPERYGEECCVIQNIGANVAPWNLANYQLGPGPTVDGKPIIFFHAHEFCKRDDGSFQLTNYELRHEDKELIYAPYLEAYARAEEQIESLLLHRS